MFEAWKIGVKISVLDYASIGLRSISSAATRAGSSIAGLEKGVASVQNRLLKGGLMVGAGVGILASLKAPLDVVRQYDLAFSKFKTLNLGDSINQQADSFAKSARLVGVSSKELMTTLSESVGLFGSFDVAKQLAPKIAQLNVANAAIFGGKMGRIDEGATRGLMKFIDRRGGTHDQETFMRNLDLAQRMVTGSGGFIRFSDLDQFSKQGGVAFRALSDQGILDSALLLQEQGGARAGTAMMSIFQNLISGRTTRKTMGFIESLGLAKLQMETHGSVGGKPIKSLVMSAIKDASLLQSDAPAWIRQVWLPALAAHGITSQDAVLRATNDLLSNRTGAGQASIMSTQLLQIIRDSNLAKNAQGFNQTIKTFAADPNSKFIDLHAKYENLLVALGSSALPLAISALTKLIPIIQSATAWVYKHSTATKVLVSSVIGLGVAATVGGTISILTGSIQGLGIAFKFLPGLISRIPAILTGIGEAFLFVGRALLLNPIGLAITAIGVAAYEIYKHWATIGPYFKKAWDAVKSVAQTGLGYVTSYVTAVSQRTQAVWATIAPYLSKMWNIAKALFHVGVDFFTTNIASLFSSMQKIWVVTKPFAILIENIFLSTFDAITSTAGKFVSAITSILAKLWDWLANSPLGKAAGWVGGEAKQMGSWVAGTAGEFRGWLGGEVDKADAFATRINQGYAAEHGDSPYRVAAASGKPIQVTTQINLDGKAVATAVTKHQVASSTGPQTGMTSFDSSMAPSPVGLSYGY